jgi:hypothetical protein
MNHLPAIIAAFEPLGFPGALLPTSKLNPGLEFPWKWRFDGENMPSIDVLRFGSCDLLV